MHADNPLVPHAGVGVAAVAETHQDILPGAGDQFGVCGGQKCFGHHLIHHGLVDGIIFRLDNLPSLTQILRGQAFLKFGFAILKVENFAPPKQFETTYPVRARILRARKKAVNSEWRAIAERCGTG